MRDLIVDSLDQDKAEDINVIPLSDESALADYMIVASGRSTRQVVALADKLHDRLKARGVKNIRMEGKNEANWVILDAGDIIIHLFRPEVREYYSIEKMWSLPHYADGGSVFTEVRPAG